MARHVRMELDLALAGRMAQAARDTAVAHGALVSVAEASCARAGSAQAPAETKARASSDFFMELAPSYGLVLPACGDTVGRALGDERGAIERRRG